MKQLSACLFIIGGLIGLLPHVASAAISRNHTITATAPVSHVVIADSDMHSPVFLSVRSLTDNVSFSLNPRPQDMMFSTNAAGNAVIGVSIKWDRQAKQMPIVAQLSYQVSLDF